MTRQVLRSCNPLMEGTLPPSTICLAMQKIDAEETLFNQIKMHKKAATSPQGRSHEFKDPILHPTPSWDLGKQCHSREGHRAAFGLGVPPDRGEVASPQHHPAPQDHSHEEGGKLRHAQRQGRQALLADQSSFTRSLTASMASKLVLMGAALSAARATEVSQLYGRDGVWEIACAPHSWLSEACSQPFPLALISKSSNLKALRQEHRPRRPWFSLPCTKWRPLDIHQLRHGGPGITSPT